MKNSTVHSLFIVLFLSVMMPGFVSCRFFRQHSQDGIVVQVGGEQLTLTELDCVTANATSEQDSADMAERYIRQWAGERLLYQKAKDRPIANLESLVEDYRNSLYVHEYEQQLVARKMPKFIHDTVIAEFYSQHTDRFILRENIVKGIFLVFPKDAPHQKELHQWLTGWEKDENMEAIEKYAYQYATGYEWFTETWKTANQILLRLPLQTDILQQQLRSHDQCVEISDSVSTYVLQVTDCHLFGEPMPLDYAANEIKQIILSERQVSFLQQYRLSLFEDGVRFGKVKIYKSEN